MIGEPLIYGIVVSAVILAIYWKCTPIRPATFDDE